MRTMITKEIQETLCKEYLEGKSITALSKEYHKKPSTISRILKENNIEVVIGLRKRHFTTEEQNYLKYATEHYYGIKEMAEHLSLDVATVKNQLKLLGLVPQYRNKNRSLNENYFSTIDSEEKAYFLGLMYTDGSIRITNHSKQIRISLQLQDKHIIEKFLNELNSDVAIQYDRRVGKESVGFEITNEKLFDDLNSLGVIPNKTYLSERLPTVQNEYLIPFLRGLFDGDGVFSFKENYNEVSVGFVNYKMEIVKEFQSIIDKLINKENSNQIHHKNNETGNSYRCAWRGRRQVLKILTLLYGNSNIHLNRKYNKYIRLLATIADKDMV